MSETPTMPWGHLLKKHRLAAGLTQETLAERAGVGARTIRELERGTTSPRKDTARRLATSLDLSADEQASFAAAATSRPRRRLSAGPIAVSAQAPARSEGVPRPSRETPPHNLPLQLTSFVGRVQEIVDLAHLVTSTRLLTLTGAGGVGKSRLALQVGERVRHRYAQGVWQVNLGPLSDPTLVSHKVAVTLGVTESPDQALDTAVMMHLRRKHLLLILDNCEHLLDACATLAETLLRADPRVWILVTSREPLGIAGETTWIVPPLPVPDTSAPSDLEDLARYEAVQLFVDRARAARPGFTLTARNAAPVARICRRLDGIPLALELAAARVRAVGVAAVAAHLDRQFTLLTGGSRTALPRHRTLRATLDWSYNMLTDPERLLFDRLSVFAGHFTLDAAAAVCTGDGLAPGDVLDLLPRVVDKSLVQFDEAGGAARYWLLDSVRRYGRERLEARGETERVKARQAAYYLAAVQRDPPPISGPAPVAWLDWLEGELDNIRAVLSWCLDNTAGQPVPVDRQEMGLRLADALVEFWYWRAHRREGLQWLDRALERNTGTPTVARARALIGAGSLLWTLGDHPTGRARFSDAIAIYRTLGPPMHLALALCLFGYWLRGGQQWLRGLGGDAPTPREYQEGTALMDEGLAVVQEVGDPAHCAWAGVLSATSADVQDAHERAAAWVNAEESLLVYQEMGDPQGIGLAQRVLGGLALYEQDYERARAAFSAAVTALRAFGDVADVALDLEHLGQIAQAQGDVAAATRHYEDSLALYRTIDFDRDLMSRVLRILGDIALERGDVDAASSRYAESLVRAQDARKPAQVAEALEALARLADAQGRTPRAVQLRHTSAELREAAGQPLPLAERVSLRRAVAQARQMLTLDVHDAERVRG